MCVPMFMCTCVLLCMFMLRCMLAMAHVLKSEDNFGELLLSYYHVGSRNRTPAVRLGGKCP